MGLTEFSQAVRAPRLPRNVSTLLAGVWSPLASVDKDRGLEEYTTPIIPRVM